MDFKYRLHGLLVYLSGLLEPVVQWVALVTLLIAAIGSIIFLFIPKEETFINNLFKVTPFWTVTRIVGAVFCYFDHLADLVLKQFGVKIQVECY